MRVLVTGGAGFIGSHVCDLLVEAGHEPIILDDLATGHVEQIHPKARFYQIDIGSPWLDELFTIEQPDAVIHHAAQASVRRSVEDPVFDGQVNVLGTVALLKASVKAKAKRFVFASTGGAIYGEADVIPTREDYRPLPLSPYGASKLAAEGYLSTFNALHGLSTVSLRYSNVYGPRQDPHGEAGVVAIFSGRLLTGEPAVINGDGKQTRDYVYARDVAKANMKALESDAVGQFNIGTGTETDVNGIFAILRELTGSKQEEKHGPARPGEQRRSCIDPSKAGKVFGWAPKTGLREGLAETVDFFRAKVSSESRPTRRQAG